MGLCLWTWSPLTLGKFIKNHRLWHSTDTGRLLENRTVWRHFVGLLTTSTVEIVCCLYIYFSVRGVLHHNCTECIGI